jgi:hypothetical protein
MKDGFAAALGRQVSRLLPRPWRMRASVARAEALSVRTRVRLATLARGGRPIIVGPWLGEVGFELLYWVPFLAWFADRFAVRPERIVAVSRGGTAPWYGHVASRYVDVFELIDSERFRRGNAARIQELGEQKQVAVTAFDTEISEAVRNRFGIDAAMLHPSIMHALFSPYWWGHLPIDWIGRHTRFVSLTRPALPGGLLLPRDYAAVKFYFNDCFRPGESTGSFVSETVREMAAESPVVSLSTGLLLDDHAVCETNRHPGIVTFSYDARTNLAVQSAIVAGARRFVGTYGGFAYLAPFYGVPADAYFSDPNGFSRRHLDVAQFALAQLGHGGKLNVRPAVPERHPVGTR